MNIFTIFIYALIACICFLLFCGAVTMLFEILRDLFIKRHEILF
jgi:hypothetical protein